MSFVHGDGTWLIKDFSRNLGSAGALPSQRRNLRSAETFSKYNGLIGRYLAVVHSLTTDEQHGKLQGVAHAAKCTILYLTINKK